MKIIVVERAQKMKQKKIYTYIKKKTVKIMDWSHLSNVWQQNLRANICVSTTQGECPQ